MLDREIRNDGIPPILPPAPSSILDPLISSTVILILKVLPLRRIHHEAEDLLAHRVTYAMMRQAAEQTQVRRHGRVPTHNLHERNVRIAELVELSRAQVVMVAIALGAAAVVVLRAVIVELGHAIIDVVEEEEGFLLIAVAEVLLAAVRARLTDDFLDWGADEVREEVVLLLRAAWVVDVVDPVEVLLLQ